MKANYKREPTVKKSNIEAVVRSEFNKQLDNVYNEVKNDIATQHCKQNRSRQEQIRRKMSH